MVGASAGSASEAAGVSSAGTAAAQAETGTGRASVVLPGATVHVAVDAGIEFVADVGGVGAGVGGAVGVG